MEDWLGLVDAFKKMMMKESEKIRNKFVKAQEVFEDWFRVGMTKQVNLDKLMTDISKTHHQILT